jgi:hypothetical protein
MREKTRSTAKKLVAPSRDPVSLRLDDVLLRKILLRMR